MRKVLTAVTVMSPHGASMRTIEATGPKGLAAYDQCIKGTEQVLKVTIVDLDLTYRAGGDDIVVAEIPTGWATFPLWAFFDD